MAHHGKILILHANAASSVMDRQMDHDSLLHTLTMSVSHVASLVKFDLVV